MKRVFSILMALAMCLSLIGGVWASEAPEDAAPAAPDTQEPADSDAPADAEPPEDSEDPAEDEEPDDGEENQTGDPSDDDVPAVSDEEDVEDDDGWGFQDACGENLTWTLSEDGVLTVSGEGEMYDVDWGFLFSDDIDLPWASDSSSIESVVIEEGVTSIGEGAFHYCYALKDVKLPESLTEIGSRAFEDCTSLEKVDIPAGVMSFGYDAFEGTPWQEKQGDFVVVNGVLIDYQGEAADVVVPDDVTRIGALVIRENESMKSFTAPDSVTRIDALVFGGCENLESVTLPACADAPAGVVSDGRAALLFGLHGAFEYYAETLQLESGEEVDYDALPEISLYGFFGCPKLTSVSLPGSVALIDGEAFEGCDSLSDIWFNGTAEQWTEVLVDGSIPEGVTVHFAGEEQAKSGRCGYDLTWTLSDDGVLTISGEGEMEGGYWDDWDTEFLGMPWEEFTSEIKSVVIEEGVSSIGECAFWDCALESVFIPKSVTYIGQRAFYCNGGLQTVEYAGTPEEWLSIDSRCGNENVLAVMLEKNGFTGGAMEDAVWTLTKDGVLTVSGTGRMRDADPGFLGFDYPLPWAGFGPRVTSVVIEEGITSVGESAFAGCEALKDVTLPESLTEIGSKAFEDCTTLEKVDIPAGVTSFGYDAFEGTPWQEKQGDFVVVNGILIDYQGEAADVVVPDDVIRIGALVFGQDKTIRSFTVPDSVTGIDALVFGECENLESVTLPACAEAPAGVVTSGSGLFLGFNYLIEHYAEMLQRQTDEEVDHDALPEISLYGFVRCPKLKSVSLPESVALIDGEAFTECDSLTDIWYNGTAAQWAEVECNDSFEGVTVHTLDDGDGDGALTPNDAAVYLESKPLQAAALLKQLVGIG